MHVDGTVVVVLAVAPWIFEAWWLFFMADSESYYRPKHWLFGSLAVCAVASAVFVVLGVFGLTAVAIGIMLAVLFIVVVGAFIAMAICR